MSDEKYIKCRICNEDVPHIGKHLKTAHPEVSEDQYKSDFPDAPMISPALQRMIEEKFKQRQEGEASAQKMVANVLPFSPPGATIMRPLHEVFELPLTDEMRKAPARGQQTGDPIMIEVRDLVGMSEEDKTSIPDIDPGFVFEAGMLKDAVMAVQLNFPLLIWGWHGTGKTSLVKQVCARTNRPWVRVQHTDTTEESHILGQMVVRNGGTEFDLGPLAIALRDGLVYVADEYDFAHAAVIAVYQAVLEGEPLYIKEAPPAMRLIKPHPMFRFIATGNTNGSGDDTGLYSGTKIGNAAAYSRFGVTIQADYPARPIEIGILRGRLGLSQDIAEKLVDFAEKSRKMYSDGELTLPISPRELIRAATLAMVKGGMFRRGIELAYSNRLSPTEASAVSQTAQRVFGS